MTSAIAAEYRLERVAQDARFDARDGRGCVDHTMTDTDEYRAYFGLGEFAGSGVEPRLTFKAYLIARAAERRAERQAAEAARLAELPTHFLVELAGVPTIDAELERRLAEYDAAHEHELEVDVVAETADLDAELAELVAAPAAPVAPVAAPAAPVAPVAAPAVRISACRTAANSTQESACKHLRGRKTSTNVFPMTQTPATAQQIDLALNPRELTVTATYGHTADAFAVGQVVEIDAQSRTRLGVVVAVGRSRVEVSWTTPTEAMQAAKFGREPLAASKSVPAKNVGKIAVDEPAPSAAVAVVDEPSIDEAIAAVEAEFDPFVIPEPAHANREAWLTAATDALRPLFEQLAGVEIPDGVRVSCGFPGGKSPAKVIGQCWYTGVDGAPQVFVSPVLVDPVDVLGVLVHELVHAWDGGKSKHRGAFAKVAKAVGLVGKMTETNVGDELRPVLVEIAADLGEYPHAKLNLAASGVAKQSTRMLKVECPSCGYTLRTTAKWLEVGVPTCPCGSEMEAAA